MSIIKKTCVCPTLPSALYPQSRPTRSCASMMSLAAETELPVCQRVRPQVDLSIFQEFNKYGIQHVLAEDELNDLYNNRFLANGVNADQYRSLCNQAPSGARESHQCVPTCKAWPIGLVHCEYKVTHNITREELDFKYPYELRIARGQEVSLKLTNSQDQAICRVPTDIPITIDPDDPEDVKSSCSISIKRTKNSVTVTPEFKIDLSETKGEINWSPEPTRMTGESAYYEVSEDSMVSIEVELEVKRGNATTVIECGDVVHPEDDEDKDDDEENEDESSLRQRLRAKGSSLLNLAKPRLRRA
ncbi:MAG: hypothetical protein LW878_01190, partial [Proteobacteria bacterium]|nr:hypothetical protein [Pseudomonadota bacterium]